MRRFAGGLLVLGLLLASSGFVAAAPSATVPLPAADLAPRVSFTLYGDAVGGWGLSSATVSKPGPTLRLYLGDNVTLNLTGKDTATRHNWFLDYNNNSQPDGAERPSPDFNGARDPKTTSFTFVADLPGSWTYRCAFHPGSMWGIFSVQAKGRPLNATLIGSAVRGWGASNTTITNPGPEIIVGAGAHVRLTLLADANDTGVQHNWFIDYDDNSEVSSGERASQTFNGQSDPKVIAFEFNATRSGTYTYRCAFHPRAMTGSITILGQASAPPNGLGIGIVPAVLLVALAGVLIFAVVYEIRARRAAKRRK